PPYDTHPPTCRADRAPPDQHSSPPRRSSDLEAPDVLSQGLEWLTHRGTEEVRAARERILGASPPPRDVPAGKTVLDEVEGKWPGDRKSTRLNSSHLVISYAVFCLKKKNS